METPSAPASVDALAAEASMAAAAADAADSRPATAGDREPHARTRIRVVDNVWLQRLLIAAPVGVGVVLVWFGFFVADPMYGTGLVTVIAAFVVFHVFAARIPDAFDRLPVRGVVAPEDLGRYRRFERGVEDLMNARRGLVPGVLLAAFAIARFPTAAGGIDRWLFGSGARSLPQAGPLMLADIVAEALLGLALGLVLWRMLVVALKVRELGRTFDLRLQVNHPDRCGGFRPLGDLCLWNALLVTVPAIFLGAWVVLAPGIERYSTTYVGLHTGFLAFLAVLAPITFLAPLWSIHQSMVRESARLRVEVEQLGQQIDRLSRDLLERSETLTPDEVAALAKDVEVRQESYRRSEKIPTWPIDLGLAVKFGTSQLVPLLSLTGLSKPIVDTIGGLAKLVEPS
jgi:hypothetical protein